MKWIISCPIALVCILLIKGNTRNNFKLSFYLLIYICYNRLHDEWVFRFSFDLPYILRFQDIHSVLIWIPSKIDFVSFPFCSIRLFRCLFINVKCVIHSIYWFKYCLINTNLSFVNLFVVFNVTYGSNPLN